MWDVIRANRTWYMWHENIRCIDRVKMWPPHIQTNKRDFKHNQIYKPRCTTYYVIDFYFSSSSLAEPELESCWHWFSLQTFCCRCWIGTSSTLPTFTTCGTYMILLPHSSNIAEGWHHGFHSMLSCSNPNLWKFLDALKAEQPWQMWSDCKHQPWCNDTLLVL